MKKLRSTVENGREGGGSSPRGLRAGKLDQEPYTSRSRMTQFRAYRFLGRHANKQSRREIEHVVRLFASKTHTPRLRGDYYDKVVKKNRGSTGALCFQPNKSQIRLQNSFPCSVTTLLCCPSSVVPVGRRWGACWNVDVKAP